MRPGSLLHPQTPWKHVCPESKMQLRYVSTEPAALRAQHIMAQDVQHVMHVRWLGQAPGRRAYPKPLPGLQTCMARRANCRTVPPNKHMQRNAHELASAKLGWAGCLSMDGLLLPNQHGLQRLLSITPAPGHGSPAESNRCAPTSKSDGQWKTQTCYAVISRAPR